MGYSCHSSSCTSLRRVRELKQICPSSQSLHGSRTITSTTVLYIFCIMTDVWAQPGDLQYMTTASCIRS